MEKFQLIVGIIFIIPAFLSVILNIKEGAISGTLEWICAIL